ncbi:MAG TPA: aspartyl/asparaginyl beta-hydroxylase domain-containing protein [Pyrinomonadaceae bacterium]|nr:aspartyl/asparaginyl beta-hydroxylase domain-containing protein [Pyrinomonadaceae bacterium]
MKKTIKYSLIIGTYLVLVYYFPLIFIPFFLIGLYDVLRNKAINFSIIKQYYLGNGMLTWLASPINLFLDIISLPFINKGVYKLQDLPESHQSEIKSLLETVKSENLIEKVAKYTEGLPRAMFFFKWYGKNMECPIEIPAFQKDFRFIRTVGISAFNVRESTTRHFGPFRPSFRVLYCINDEQDDNVYIHVGNVKHRWKEEKLFIFDDTLLHQSFNESDHPRFCLFVDILRPSYLSFINDFAVSLIRIGLQSVKGIFYKKWKVIEN